MTDTTFVLSFHAAYGCRDRGACCTAGWPIPIESDALANAERAIDEGRLRMAAPAFVRPANAPRETPALVATAADACVFYRQAGAARCELHRALGHAALPLACRQFPRVSLRDPRGVSITLSHYCPTAAELLDDETPVTMIENAPAFPPDAEYVGLDARQSLPPALRPDMLMDWESWWLWERESVALLADVDDPSEVLTRLAAAVEHTRTWRPDDGPLMTRVKAAFETARHGDISPRQRMVPDAELVAGVFSAVPQDHHAAAVRAAERTSAQTTRRAHRRFLMAHAFASWTAHLGEGLRTWLRSIEAAHALIVSGRSVRDADLLLRHLAEPHVLARAWGRAEHT